MDNPIACTFVNPQDLSKRPYLKISFSRLIAWENIQELAAAASEAIQKKVDCLMSGGPEGGTHGTA